MEINTFLSVYLLFINTCYTTAHALIRYFFKRMNSIFELEIVFLLQLKNKFIWEAFNAAYPENAE